LKKQSVIVLAATIVMVLALVLSGCAPSTTGPTSTSTVADRTYNAMNPRGIQQPVQISPLAARLDTIKGKVIYINQGEADPIIMPAIWERVQKEFPDTTWKYIFTSSFGPPTPEDEVKATAKAVVRGISW
jgi:hypothetical protein